MTDSRRKSEICVAPSHKCSGRENKMLRKHLHADILKMKGTPVILAHILIPIITSGVFLLYYSFSAWNDATKIMAFYQAVGAGFPVLIGIFCASVAAQEKKAGGFQNLLSLPHKTTAFWSKVFLLLLFGMFSILFTAILFGYGFCRTPECSISIGLCITMALIMWCSSIPLYLWQMILAFQFGEGVSVCAGIVSSLVSALMLTGLGKFIWKFTVISWTARIPYTFLKLVFGEVGAYDELKAVLPLYAIFTVISMLYYFLWASYFEGCKLSE